MKRAYDPKTASVFTTGDIAKLCNCCSDTVARWVDSGKLLATKLPSGFRRVPRQDLVSFLTQSKMWDQLTAIGEKPGV